MSAPRRPTLGYEQRRDRDLHVSGLFDGTFARGGAAAAVSDEAWFRALLEVEAALARAAAGLGLVPTTAADAVTAACADPGRLDLATVVAKAADAGNPVPPLVRVLQDAVGERDAVAVHVGATSQDILDTALRAAGPQRDLRDRRRPRRRGRRRGRAGRAPPGRRRHGPHPDAAGAADDVRAQGGRLAERPGRRAAAAGRGGRLAAGPVRRRGRHARRQRRLRASRCAAALAEELGLRRPPASRGTPSGCRSPTWPVRSGRRPGWWRPSPSTSSCSPRPRSPRSRRSARPGAARRRCRTRPTRSPRSPPAPAPAGRPGWWPPCSPRWSRSTSGPPAPGTASGRR